MDALTGPTADPNRRVTTVNAPGAEVGPGQVATWGVVRKADAVGFDGEGVEPVGARRLDE